ncbi:MAG: hypothetical protein ACYTGP_12040, partial [Planctomycetota bacterium]
MLGTAMKIGTLVVNPRMSEWGPGKIVAIEGSSMKVVFRDDPGSLRSFNVTRHPLVVEENQTDEILDEIEWEKAPRSPVKPRL